MSWMTDIADPAAARERALKSLSVPLGLANPLWLAFGAAAGAGACWWLLTRLANPFNAEALFAGAAPAKATLKAVKPAAEAAAARPVDERTPVTTPVLLEVALDVAPTLVEAAQAPVEAALEAVHETLEAETPIAETAPEAVTSVEASAPEAEVEDDLTRMVGVGPRTARALIDRGVTRFAQLAAWTEDQMAAFDHELSLKGRSTRDAWLAQAKRFAAES